MAKVKRRNSRLIFLNFDLLVALSINIVMGLACYFITKKIITLPLFVLSGILSYFAVRIMMQFITKKVVSRLASDLELIKRGDFSKLLDSKSYGLLSGIASIINMLLSDIRMLIDNFNTISASVFQASSKVSQTSQEASIAIEDIAKTIDEIAKGASEQAQEAQHGVEMVDSLSEQINHVYENYNDITAETGKISQLNQAGLESVRILQEKSEENSSANEKIFSVIERLTNSVKDINLFVESIENIAEQTNLLALNAAIEAARAGEAGRSFAVVAQEVRELADESRKSTEEITNLMHGIQEEAAMAVEVMELVKNVAQEQNAAVEKTNEAFRDIAGAITSIVKKIEEVNYAISQVQNDKNKVISAIESISSVSEETAASSQEVASTTESQLRAIQGIKEDAEALFQEVQELEEKLKRYKLR